MRSQIPAFKPCGYLKFKAEGIPLPANCLLSLLVFGFCLESLMGCAHKTLRVAPREVNLPLDQSVVFTASLTGHSGTPLKTSALTWQARNVDEHRPARITPQGIFTARLPGRYKITVRSGHEKGHAMILVPDGVTHNPNEQPSQITTVSVVDDGGNPPALPAPAIISVAWQDSNFRRAFDIQNHRGLDPLRPYSLLTRAPALNTDAGIGNGNYLLTIPILNLPGREQTTALNLYYNSKVWLKTDDQTLVYDHSHGWPAPGWSLGFGKVVRMGSYGVGLEDADGSLHAFGGIVNTYTQGFTQFVDHTTDGTLLNCRFLLLNGSFRFGSVSYPNGTLVEYGAPGDDGNSIYPTRITDANGNYITMSYRNNAGPQLERVTDTLGRAIDFYYSPENQLSAITAPDFGDGKRTLVRLHYQLKDLQYAFAPGINSIGSKQAWIVDAVYFPVSSTGYWFGDQDSYSTYGTIAKVSQRRGMGLQSSSLKEQGNITSTGAVTRERVYNYPLTADPTLTDAPTYTQMTETWAGMDVPPAVTTYSVKMQDNPRRIDTIYPDGTHVAQLMYAHPGKYDDGLLYQQLTYNQSGQILRTVTTSWELGDFESPRVTNVQIADETNQATTTAYSYASPNNQLIEVRQLDYDGKTLLRRLHTDYLSDPAYTARNIFNLPSLVQLYGADGNVVSRTEYVYDRSPLSDTAGVVGHSDASNPYANKYWVPPDEHLECVTRTQLASAIYDKASSSCVRVHDPGSWAIDYNSATDYRGNLTEVNRYADAANPKNSIRESRSYDIDGNLVATRPACCEESTFGYTLETQFAYPTVIGRGAPPPSSARVSTVSSYDFNTGLQVATRDVNARTTNFSYEKTTLRPLLVTRATASSIAYSYDDNAMTTTQTVREASGNVASQVVTHLNGSAEAQHTETLAAGNIWNAVANEYDALGRISRFSQPFQVGRQPVWNQVFYDSLGRVTQTQDADGSRVLTCYNDSNRPASASPARGLIVRTISSVPSSASTTCQTPSGSDPGVRERWSRIDALGRLTEVVEPDAYGNGSVFSPNSVDTSYTYDARGAVTQIMQGADRQRGYFQYDSLGRLTAQYLPEKSATLDTHGIYVGPKGSWSDVFTYDDRSNLVSQTDARGIKTIYDYGSDPLDRLQHVTYDTSGFGDTINPVVPAPTVTYRYMTTGDLTRPFEVAMQRGGDNSWGLHEYGYDQEGRLTSKMVSYPGHPPLALDYKYDTLNRVVGRTYPTEYGTTVSSRKRIEYSYGVGGLLSDLKVDGVDYASQLHYNPAAQVTSVMVGAVGPHQATETYSYDEKTDLMFGQQVKVNGSVLLELAYHYLPGRQLSQLVNNLDARKSTNYTYDALGRLWSVKGGSVTSPEWTESYTFDPYGNRTGVAASGRAPDGSPIPVDGLPALSYDGRSNRVTTPGFQFDAAGNQTRAQRGDGSWVRYEYDAASRLAQVTDDKGTFLEGYLYSFDRHRSVRLSGENPAQLTYYFWSGDHVVAEYIEQGSATFAWGKSAAYLGDRLLVTFLPSSTGEITYYHHPDRLGTRLITDNRDDTATEQVTLPFGTLIPGGSPNPINPIFTSYDRSTATAVDYAVNRHYDPQERFTQIDPAELAATSVANPQSLNLYSYVGNDPINGNDPSGLEIDFATLKALITVAGALAAIEDIRQAPWFALAYGLVELAEKGGLLSTSAFSTAIVGDVALSTAVANQVIGNVTGDVRSVLTNSGGFFHGADNNGGGGQGTSVNNTGNNNTGGNNYGAPGDTSGSSKSTRTGTVTDEGGYVNGYTDQQGQYHEVPAPPEESYNPEGDYGRSALPPGVIVGGPGIASFNPEGNGTSGWPSLPGVRNPRGPAGYPVPDAPGGGPSCAACAAGIIVTSSASGINRNGLSVITH